jgi:hypothetical protein
MPARGGRRPTSETIPVTTTRTGDTGPIPPSNPTSLTDPSDSTDATDHESAGSATGSSAGSRDRTTRGRLRSALRRLTSSDAELEAEDLRSESSRLGGTTVSELPDRAPAVVCGTIRTTTLRPRAGTPALVAEVYDGTGVLTVVWLGRRTIAGIEAGRRIRVRGRVAQRDGRPVVFNPRYELLPAVAE